MAKLTCTKHGDQANDLGGTFSGQMRMPGGVWVGWGVSEAQEAFVTSLAGGSVARA